MNLKKNVCEPCNCVAAVRPIMPDRIRWAVDGYSYHECTKCGNVFAVKRKEWKTPKVVKLT